jgi:cobalamin synthase
MTLESDDAAQRLSTHAAWTFAALVCELPSMLVLIALWSNPDSSLDSNPTAAALDGQHGLELACRFVVIAVPLALLAAAAWRRYWAVVSIQVGLLVLEACLAFVLH